MAEAFDITWGPWGPCVNNQRTRAALAITQTEPCTIGPGPGGPTTITEVHSSQVNMASLLMFRLYHDSSRYERFNRLVEMTGATFRLEFLRQDLAAGGVILPLAGVYSLMADGQVLQTITLPAGSMAGAFTLTLDDAQRWRVFSIVGSAAESTVPFPMVVNKSGAPFTPTEYYICTGSYDLTHESPGRHRIYKVTPAAFTPRVLPLAPRECPPFADATPRASLYMESVVPVRRSNIFRPNVNAHGIISTANKQSYFWSDMIRKIPNIPLLDGPRGDGCLSMPTHLQVGHTGGCYFTDPWRFGQVTNAGVVRTLVGYRHRKPPAIYRDATAYDPAELELVGDWSAIPLERRGLHEAWGLAWDQDSLALDPNAAPVNGLQPHLNPPRAFLTDVQNNRVLLVTFSKNDITAPAVVTEFLTGLANPWDVLWVAGKLYISERTAHRISVWDAKTKASLGTLVQGANLASLDAGQKMIARAPLNDIRAQPCVGPEGLYHQDGQIFFGSYVMQQVRKVTLSTLFLEVVANPTIDDNSRFVKVALSDGTFGPRGTVFSATWSIANFGMPEAFLPTGGKWAYYSYSDSILSRGKGGAWQTLGYTSAVGIGMGRIYTGSSEEGLIRFSKALPTDPAPDYARYKRGRDLYYADGNYLVHGQDGFGWTGAPLPWGKPDKDYYLGWQGHTIT